MERRWLNVIVVDDELPLRQELRSFPWEHWGAVLAGEAENGLEALQLCRDRVPDVVVTDITMPMMNGMELFEQIRKEFPHIQVILLTCHSDFHYAREAMKLGALEYLVKVTLEESELEHALDRAREAIERELAHRRNAMEQRRREQSKLLGRLLKDKSSPDGTIVAELSRCGVLRELPTRSVLLKVLGREEDRVFIEQEIQSALEAMEPPVAPGFTWLPVCSMEYMFVFPESNLPTAQLKYRLESIIRGLTQSLDDNLSFLGREAGVFGVISESVTSGSEFIRAFGHLKLWEQAKFYETDAAQAVFVGKPVPLAPLTRDEEAALTDRLRRFDNDEDGMKAYIESDFVRWCQKHRFYPDELKKALGAFLSERRADGDAVQDDLPGVEQAATVAELTAAVIRAVERKGGKRSRLRKEVRDAMAYIEAHLEEAVTLPVLADHVSLSPHYLSRLFREEVGESVNEYMTRMRMEKAIDMLQNTNLKVYEVADKVGIPSYRYFSTIFRSWTGVAPTDYKKHQTGSVSREGGAVR